MWGCPLHTPTIVLNAWAEKTDKRLSPHRRKAEGSSFICPEKERGATEAIFRALSAAEGPTGPEARFKNTNIDSIDPACIALVTKKHFPPSPGAEGRPQKTFSNPEGKMKKKPPGFARSFFSFNRC